MVVLTAINVGMLPRTDFALHLASCTRQECVTFLNNKMHQQKSESTTTRLQTSCLLQQPLYFIVDHQPSPINQLMKALGLWARQPRGVLFADVRINVAQGSRWCV